MNIIISRIIAGLGLALLPVGAMAQPCNIDWYKIAGAGGTSTGRVYVMADSCNGAIHPGDMLTSSSQPGDAMKVADRARAAGAIPGKAMTSLSRGRGWFSSG